MAPRRVASLQDLWSGEKVGLTVDGTRVLLVNLEGRVYAFEDRCPHLGLPLSDGLLDGSRLTCRGHHWQYDVCTGQGVNPAATRLRSVPVRVEDDQVLVDVERLG